MMHALLAHVAERHRGAGWMLTLRHDGDPGALDPLRALARYQHEEYDKGQCEIERGQPKCVPEITS
jgi:hypothetical protein